jgi:hypothetical protein
VAAQWLAYPFLESDSVPSCPVLSNIPPWPTRVAVTRHIAPKGARVLMAGRIGGVIVFDSGRAIRDDPKFDKSPTQGQNTEACPGSNRGLGGGKRPICALQPA